MCPVTGVRQIPTNPGGTLPPEHVLGRDELIAQYWQKLETQSIALLAPRRFGKTSITKRMLAYPISCLRIWTPMQPMPAGLSC